MTERFFQARAPFVNMEKEMSHHVMTAVLASALILAATAHADTLTVCASGCNYSSIKDAIDGAGDGDVIQVEQGAWFENELNTDGKAITIIGSLGF